jgi:hypothetical protein
MNLADDTKLTAQLTTCSSEAFKTLIALGEKVNAEYGNKPGNPIAFSHLVVAMCGWLSEMFPGHTSTIQLDGSYFQETGVVDLPNLVPVIEKLVQERKAQETRTLYPTKGDTAPMSQPITEQDVADYLEKFIQTSELVPDQMKELFIGRVTNLENPASLPVSFIKEADDTLSVVIGDKKWPLTWEGMIGDSTEDALEFDHAVSEVGLLQRSYYTRVRRDSEDAPCPIQITKEANRTFSVVIGGKGWPIGSYGTIGHTVQDGEDFQKALLQHGSVAHAGGPYVVRIPSTDEIWSDKVSTKEHQARLARLSRDFEHAMKARGGVGKSVGQIAYEGFYEHQSAPLYESLPQEEQLRWELAGTRAFTWMSVVPEEIEKEIQIIAGRKRLQILSQTNWGKRYREEHQEEATLLNSLAGFPRAPEPKS